MKIQFFSDIHNYDLSFMPKKTDADILICAGDFDMGTNVKSWADKVVEYHKVPLLFGLGNHDYWNTSQASHTVEEWIDIYESYNTDMIQFLEKKTILFGDVAIIFATGWSDFDRNNNVSRFSAERIAKDFDKIRTNNGKLTTEDVYQNHLQARDFIISELEKHSDKKCVVVTHYPPSIICNTTFQINAASYYWCGQMEDVILDYKPVAWISGHMHNPFDKFIGDTRVLINPAGNIKNGTPQINLFKDDFVIDVFDINR